MQPLQRSYAITAERIEAMLTKGSLSSLYDQAKVDELESLEEPTGKDIKKLEAYQNNLPVYEAIITALNAAVSDEVYYSPAAFMPVLTKALATATTDKKLLEKIADGLSVMDKKAEIQRDRKGNIIYDKETKDTELVKFEEHIDDYMAREVLPHIPDAVAFFEENLGAKKPIWECDGLNEPVDVDNAVSVLMCFHKKLFEHFPPVTATMISLEFQNAVHDWITAIKENRVSELQNTYNDMTEDDHIHEFIFADSPYQSCGCDSLLQVLLSSYYCFARTYVNTKYMFLHIVGERGESKQREKVLQFYSSLYGEHMDMQHIDFRFLATVENGIESLFTIKSSMSLLLFEMAHCQQIDRCFVKCGNCGNIFVPEGRSDTIYCSYISPQNKSRTCKEIGAQVARSNKEKNDVVTGAYRKAYMRHKMMTKRHPYDKSKQSRFRELTEGMKIWRVKLADGSSTSEEFLSWLEQF